MITRAIIENITSKGVIVRIPTLNKSSVAIGASSASELDYASICTLPGILPKYQIGDAVYIAFEDDDLGNPIVLGKLRDSKSSSVSDIDIHSLKVASTAQLPESLNMGDLNLSRIKKLLDTESNLQRQLDTIKSQLAETTNILESLQKKIQELTK